MYVLFILEVPMANEKGFTLIGVILHFLNRTSIIDLFSTVTVIQLITVALGNDMVNASPSNPLV